MEIEIFLEDQGDNFMSATLCIKCGRERILSKKWTQKAGGKGTAITYELYVCPDSECQKLVDQKFEDMRQRKLGFQNKKQG